MFYGSQNIVLFMSILKFKYPSIIALFVGLFICGSLIGQSAMGGWTLHVPKRGSIGVAGSGDLIYCAFSNGVLEYDQSTGEKTMLSSINFLSDNDLSAIGEVRAHESVFIGYQNGNIDKIKNGNITNIPAIRLAEIQGVKKINRFVEHEEDLYVATGFGIVRIDSKNDEVRESYFPTNNNESVIDLAFHQDTLYASIGQRILKVFTGNPAIADPSQWVQDERFPQLDTASYKDLITINGELFVNRADDQYGKDSIFQLTPIGLQYISEETFEFEIASLSEVDGKLAANIDGATLVYNADLQGYAGIYNTVPSGDFLMPFSTISIDDKVFMSDRNEGLIQFSLGGGGSKIDLIGPPKNSFYQLDYGAAGLIVAGGGVNGKQRTFNNSGAYTYQDYQWKLYDVFTHPEWADSVEHNYDYTCVGAHHRKNQFAVGTYSDAAITLFEDGEIKAIYDQDNSPLEKVSIGNDDYLITDIEYDLAGNLYAVNAYASEVLKVLDRDGEWHGFDMGVSSRNKFTGDIRVDYNGHVWLAVDGQGLFAINFNNTLDNPDDDLLQHFTNNENSGDLPSNNVTSLAVDFDNEIWVGTENGFAIIYNSQNTFEADPGEYNAQRIKLEFEGNVEFLLGSTFISDIEVDGGNRKWMGTAGSGIFCLSPDGLTIIHNFTKENSPLISDNILDLEIDSKTGEMYIITDKGMISYRIDASAGSSDYEEVQVFPNPVRPEFNGVITIQGIKYDSDVRITDLGGNLVYKTTSNGGTATWNGRRITGERVASGVYLIWTAENNGKGRQVGKVAVINSGE